MKIYIATDHNGVEYEKDIVSFLENKNYEVKTASLSHSDTDDYVDFALEIANNVSNDNESLGILICGTGIGMSIAANKVKGIRAARCTNKDDAYLARFHNNANIICLSYRLPLSDLIDIINTFITTDFSNEERHVRRVEKIIKYEDGAYNGL